MRASAALVLGLTMVAVSGQCAAQQAPARWSAGVARVDITPQEPIWLAGYGARNHEAEGTIHPLWVKALALQDAEAHKAVLITSDVLGFPQEMSERICARLHERLGLERAQILLNSSHTHSGPVLYRSLWSIYPLDAAQQEKVNRYSGRLEGQVVDCAVEAFAAMKPAHLFSGNGVTRFAVNRRNNAEAKVPDLHEFKGPVDHAVPVLKVTDEAGGLLAVAFGYACHATVLDSYQWCGDYPGFAQLELESVHPGATALFFAGCGADQNPLPRRSVALAQQYGRELAAAVERMINDKTTELEPSLKTEYLETELALSTPPTREELAAIAQTGNIYDKRAAESFLKQLDEGKTLRTSYPYPVQLWRVGGQTIVALGGEVVVDYAILLKEMFGRDTFVMGYSNDLMSYIPSVRVLHEGGYEGTGAQMEYDMPAAWNEDVESRILAAVRELAGRAGVSTAACAAK